MIIGCSENLLVGFFLVGWLRWDIIIIVVLVFKVVLIVGIDVLICVLEVILLFFIGMFKFCLIRICWLLRVILFIFGIVIVFFMLI